jgi:hypothetical protein
MGGLLYVCCKLVDSTSNAEYCVQQQHATHHLHMIVSLVF